MFAQLDFATRDDPEWGQYVPTTFRNYTYVTQTQQALKEGRSQDAFQHAQDLVSARPIPAESLSALAISADLVARPGLAQQAVWHAAERGWRDRLSQFALLQVAAQGEDWPVAAQRSEALWRRSVPLETLIPWLELQIAVPAARDALMDRLAGAPDYRDFLILRSGNKLSSPAYVTLIQAVGKRKLAVDCAGLGQAANRLRHDGEFSAARQVWDRGPCRDAGPHSDSSARFLASDKAHGPFAWTYPKSSGVNRIFTTDAKQPVMNVRNYDPLPRLAARRWMMQPAGRYSVALESEDGAGAPEMRLYCYDMSGEQVRSAHFRQQLSGTAHPVTLGQDCPAQRIDLYLPRGDWRNMDLRFEPSI
ncbi:hypothetical protein [Altericroceibacterium endophyticum]|uniref:Uncharacterized protein n=1 Tax=Altericroceibacterium endophyticum TaxID=1808508 RepID=A0A6I4T8C1_9SPHN|nr:hypothetical protein [Altericroceibacterium endophyticum]MXO67027.1 hypothetical protein [Altericroceibacterium endophyticum]